MILPMVKMDVILDANDHLKNTFSDQQVSFSLINPRTNFFQLVAEMKQTVGKLKVKKMFPSCSAVKTSSKRTLELWNLKN